MPIEPTVFLTFGLLIAGLIGVAVIALVHRRAVLLTTRRPKSALPPLAGETQADKDLLGAEAISKRALENIVERLRAKVKDQTVELETKEDVINRLKIERDTLNVKVAALEMQAAAGMAGRASLAPMRPLSEAQEKEDTSPRNTREDRSTQEDSFVRNEHPIEPAMSQSTEADTWTRDDRNSEPADQPNAVSSRLASALSLTVNRPSRYRRK
jgi:hypothetical protein